MKKGIIAAILTASLLTGCSIPYTVTGEKKEDTKFSNTYDLETEKIYVWKEKGYGDLRKDLSKERAGSDIFYKAPQGTISLMQSFISPKKRCRMGSSMNALQMTVIPLGLPECRKIREAIFTSPTAKTAQMITKVISIQTAQHRRFSDLKGSKDSTLIRPGI